jgi:hypothetical protein
MSKYTEYVVDAFNALTPDLRGIYSNAITYTLPSWKKLQATLVTGSGAAAVAIPGIHLVGIPADIVFLMNRMAVCSYGIGAILGNNNGYGNILEKEDFAIVLARWSGDESVSNSMIAKAAADLAGKSGGKIGAKIGTKKLASVLALSSGAIVGNKIGGKVGAKIGSKIGAKIGGKLTAGFVPLLGAAVGAGINLYFIHGIASAAEEWYEIKLSQGKTMS